MMVSVYPQYGFMNSSFVVVIFFFFFWGGGSLHYAHYMHFLPMCAKHASRQTTGVVTPNTTFVVLLKVHDPIFQNLVFSFMVENHHSNEVNLKLWLKRSNRYRLWEKYPTFLWYWNLQKFGKMLKKLRWAPFKAWLMLKLAKSILYWNA